MKVQLKPFFRDFRDNVMDGNEFKVFRVQAMMLASKKDRIGLFEKVIKVAKRNLVVNYYQSDSLDVLFVLTAHIIRAGEPREKEKEALRFYLDEIKALEAE
jgi:hypothetical protein